MARGRQQPAEQSDFEKQRLANIAERDALLKKLTQEAQQAGLYSKPPSAGTQHGQKRASKPKGPPAKRVKKEPVEVLPRRTSSRLAGLQADSEVAKHKAEVEYEQQKEVERQKRQRVTGDLNFAAADGASLIGTDVILKGVAKPYERTFDEQDIRETTDKDLKALRERMSGLGLWDQWEPNRIKITPERIYSMAFHPTTSKPIVFAGDKFGSLGIVDASQRPDTAVKEEDAGDEDEDEEETRADPQITHIKPHTRTITAMHSHPSKPQTLYTSSYDSSIRATDLSKSVAVEVYGPSSREDDEPISGVDMSATDPHTLYFTTLNGAFGRHDTRQPPSACELFQLSEKKIGGFSLHPLLPHYVATASLDRYMRLWDLRKITKKLPTLVGEHESRLSVSHAAFNTAGQVATTSYDDTIKIHSFGVGKHAKKGTQALESMSSWAAGFHLDEEAMKPEVVVRHNNQTGRWTTILKPRWQTYPEDNIQKLVVGNMNRFVDVYAANGDQLAQLGGEGITAVPAVAVFHPSKDWIAGGTSSGKLCLWM
ncbi:WD domain-containing protein [Cladophialophora immunda]|nr:WD domain-containing protein [Cladophialophora immunda]